MFRTSGRPFVHAVSYGMFFMHLCKQSSRWKVVLDTIHVGLKSKVGIINAFMKCEFLMAVTVNSVTWSNVLPPSSRQLMQLLSNSRYK
jgi:hypothetical protein